MPKKKDNTTVPAKKRAPKKTISKKVTQPKETLSNNLVGVFLLFVAAAIIIIGTIYVFQKQNVNAEKKELEVEITSLKNKLAETGTDKEKATEEMEKLQEELDAIKEKEAKAKWYEYENEEIGIKFEAPGTWAPQEIRTDTGILYTGFKIDELPYDSNFSLHVLGVNNNEFENEEDLFKFANCATEVNSIKQFCADGCRKLSDDTAIDYRAMDDNTRLSGVVYTTISEKYPSLCFELDLTRLLKMKVEENEMEPEELFQKYYINDLVDLENLEGDTLKAVEDFERFAKSIIN